MAVRTRVLSEHNVVSLIYGEAIILIMNMTVFDGEIAGTNIKTVRIVSGWKSFALIIWDISLRIVNDEIRHGQGAPVHGIGGSR